MEESAPFPLLERRSGGKGGGATLLTCRTQELLKGFMQLSEQVNIAADRSFAEIFPS